MNKYRPNFGREAWEITHALRAGNYTSDNGGERIWTCALHFNKATEKVDRRLKRAFSRGREAGLMEAEAYASRHSEAAAADIRAHAGALRRLREEKQ